MVLDGVSIRWLELQGAWEEYGRKGDSALGKGKEKGEQ